MLVESGRRTALLAALWVALGQSRGESLRPGCDDGRVLLDTDLPKDAAHWDCPTALWTTPERLNAVDTVYDPEPARLTCIDQNISFNKSIPNSGAFRPVPAESGEYLFCPAQRWLNNLHRGATVLLFHPCAPPLERLLLSALAQSCISDFILTPHKDLDTNRPVALVSWGRTLETSTAASPEICDWLDATSSTKTDAAEVKRKLKYNLYLRRAAERDERKGTKGFLKKCCQQTLSSLEDDIKKTRQRPVSRITDLQFKQRQKRAAIKPTTNLPEISVHPTNAVIHKLQKKKTEQERPQTTAHVQKQASSNSIIAKSLKSEQGGSSNLITVKEREADGAKNDSWPGARGVGGFQRTPRSDEAVWAAAALGFLLVLLTLSVLHTRLYRHWRRGPSLYWRDPRQDYESVADVIRRRLRSDKKRRRRSRKKECVLPPSSSSSDEYI